MRSPMGEGALRGRPGSMLIVADRRGFVENGTPLGVELTAVLGGGLGGPLVEESN